RFALRLVLEGFLSRDQAVSVRVDFLKLLRRAEELAPRHVAILVAVHLLEPSRPLAGGANHLASHASDIDKLWAKAAVRRSFADADPELPGQFGALDYAVAVLIKLRKVLGEVQHFALAKTIVVLRVNETKEAAALVHNRDVGLAAWPSRDG